MILRNFLDKETFKEKYKYSESTYQRRINELKNNSEYREAYVNPTSSEVWIIEEIYQQFLIWKSKNKYKETKGEHNEKSQMGTPR
ncbi:hypothetical protein [Listeria sp. ILCC792]|uniref:hypothetical protein n=1 Tax=Listeria sp. ILCC792 TaxID=1918331 RepID=UPI0015CFFDD6|nr:hypothetical protein [Listeria sp. ILCC792]